jgi:hypothetical protein
VSDLTFMVLLQSLAKIGEGLLKNSVLMAKLWAKHRQDMGPEIADMYLGSSGAMARQAWSLMYLAQAGGYSARLDPYLDKVK